MISDRASVLRYTYIVCLVILFLVLKITRQRIKFLYLYTRQKSWDLTILDSVFV